MSEQRFVLGYCVGEDGTKTCEAFPVEATQPDLYITGLTLVDGVLTIERSDGATFPATFTIPAAESEQLNIDASVAPVIDIAAQTATFTTINDVDGTAGAPYVMDLSTLFAALTSSPHPMLIAGDNITITGNDTDGYTISGPDPVVDTDTDTFATISGDTITFADGTTYTIPADTTNQSTAAPTSAINITTTNNPDGSVNYDFSIPAIDEKDAGLVFPWVASDADDCLPAPIPAGCEGLVNSITFSPEGDIFEWTGAAWNRVHVGSGTQRVNVTAEPIFTIDEAALAAAAAAPAGTSTPIGTSTASWTNPWCVPAVWSGIWRTTYQFTAVSGNRIDVNHVFAAGSNVSASGTTGLTMDTHGYPAGGPTPVQSGPQTIEFNSVVPPGATRTIAVDFLLVSREHVPAGGNRLQIGTTYVRSTAERGA